VQGAAAGGGNGKGGLEVKVLGMFLCLVGVLIAALLLVLFSSEGDITGIILLVPIMSCLLVVLVVSAVSRSATCGKTGKGRS